MTSQNGIMMSLFKRAGSGGSSGTSSSPTTSSPSSSVTSSAPSSSARSTTHQHSKPHDPSSTFFRPEPAAKLFGFLPATYSWPGSYQELQNLLRTLYWDFSDFFYDFLVLSTARTQNFFLAHPDLSHFVGMGLLGVCMLCFYRARRRMRDIEAIRSVPYTPLADLPMLLRTMPCEEGYIVKVGYMYYMIMLIVSTSVCSCKNHPCYLYNELFNAVDE